VTRAWKTAARASAFPAILASGMAAAAYCLRWKDASARSGALLAILWGAIALIAGLERLFPHRPEWNRNHGDLAADALHLVFSFTLPAKAVEAAVAALCAAAALKAAGSGWPGRTWAMGLWPARWPLAGQLALSLAVSELGLYAAHRLAHEVPALWRLHAVHHSAPRLYWLNSGRFHPLDVAFQAVPGILPLALLGTPGDVLFLHWAFTGLHGLLQHCNVDMRLGFWNRIFSTADLHRWHHALEPAFSNRNYGKVLIFWDVLFKTRHFPGPYTGELGLPREDFPKDFAGQLAAPFRFPGSPRSGV
jgi:sterol desaturase/sphingolipid hydroxylase (fatty acid hydroxylase superfamily)